MINPRIKLLLDPQFIRYSADTYQWALDAEAEYRRLPLKEREDVDAYRRGASYMDTVVELVNLEFADVIKAESLGAIDEDDVYRCWQILHRQTPSDPLGLTYTWFINRISLYVPDRNGRIHRPIDSSLSRREIIDHLFRQFLTWSEDHNLLNALSPNPSTPAFIDEIEGLFGATIDVLTESNRYVQQIFKNTPMEEEMVPNVHEATSITDDNDPDETSHATG